MSNTRHVYVAGTFDLLHPGHIFLLRQAASFGPVTVFVNTDRFVEQFKRRPVQTQEMRLAVVSELKTVRQAYFNDNADLRKTLAPFNRLCCYIVVGGDYDEKTYAKQTKINEEWLHQWEADLIFVPRWAGFSSTELRERLNPAT